MQQSSLKNWNREVLMLKGLDIHYMPYLVTDDKLVKTNFDAPGASGKFRDQLMEFCGCLGQQLTRDTFMQFDKLHEWGCKHDPDFLLFPPYLCFSFACLFSRTVK